MNFSNYLAMVKVSFKPIFYDTNICDKIRKSIVNFLIQNSDLLDKKISAVNTYKKYITSLENHALKQKLV